MIVTYKRNKKLPSGRPERYGRKQKYFLVTAHSKDMGFFDALDDAPIVYSMDEAQKKLNKLSVGSYIAFYSKKHKTWYYEMKTSCRDCKCESVEIYYIRRKFGAPYWLKMRVTTKCQLKNTIKNIHTFGTL